jgi:hypothetical protein
VKGELIIPHVSGVHIFMSFKSQLGHSTTNFTISSSTNPMDSTAQSSLATQQIRQQQLHNPKSKAKTK